MLTYRHFISNHQYILKAFTGMITDSAGRKRYYVNGKPVKHDTYVGAGHKEHAHTHEQSIRTAVGALSGRASKGTSHADLTQLAEHLNNISGTDLKKLRAKYGISAEKNPNKEKLVAALLDHVRGGGPAVDVRKFREQFGIAPPKEAMDSKAGRAKVNDLLARARKGEDVLDEVKKLKDYDAGLDFGMDAMDEGKTAPTKRESDPKTKKDKVTAEAEARTAWDQGQKVKQEVAGVKEGSVEEAKPAAEANPAKPKEPWQMNFGDLYEYLEANPEFAKRFYNNYSYLNNVTYAGFIDDAIKAGKDVPFQMRKELGLLKPWEMTQGNYLHKEKMKRGLITSRLYNSDGHKEDHREIVEQALAAGKPVPAEVLADYPDLAGKAAGQEPAKPKSIDEMTAGLHSMAAEQVRDHLPILEKQMDNEVNPRKKWMAANNVLDGLNPAAQKVLLQHIRDTQPDVFAEAKAKASPSMRGVIDQVSQSSPSKAAAPQPPEPGFTGRAANGVYFINGVAQKQADQPTAGMPRPSAESGLGSGSMQKLAAENKPAAKEEEAAKQDAIGKYLSHIDPEQVKQLQTRHANVIDTLTSELKKAQAVEDDMLKQYTAADKSKKSSLGRKLNEAKEAANEALNKLADYKYETVDNRKAAIAIDPNQPDFVRLAAGMKPNDDEAANKVIELANQWVKSKGEDPRLGDLLASQVLERPLSAGEELGKLLQGEKNRLATMDARKDAAKYVAGLDLLPGQKAEAEREAASLYNGDQDRFRQKWDAVQESSKADREKEKQAKAKLDKQLEEQAKTEAGIKSYLAAVDAGKPVGDASQDVLRGAAEHVLRSPEQWHSNYEMPKGMNAKQAVDDILKNEDQSANRGYNFGLTILKSGWLSDMKYMMKATPQMMEQAEKNRKEIEANLGRVLPVQNVLPQKTYESAKVVAGRTTDGNSQILLQSDDGSKNLALNPKYYATISSAYPDAQWSIDPKNERAIATSGGETVGVIMALSNSYKANGSEKIGTYRDFGSYFEPNQLGENAIAESARGLAIGQGTPEAAEVQIKKDGKKYVVKAPGIGNVMMPGLREAKAKAKEILLHAHGTDEQGNLILKPKA